MDFKQVSLNVFRVIPMLLAFGILYSCENDLKEIESLLQKENLPVRVGKNVELIYSEKAQIKVKIIAPVMKRFTGEENYLEMPKGIEVLFYDSLMNVSSKLTSNYAIHKMDENKMEAKDDVVVINEKGEQLNTEHLIWVKDSSKIYSDEFVKITTADEILMGEKFEADQNFTWYKIHQLTGIIDLKEESDSTKTE